MMMRPNWLKVMLPPPKPLVAVVTIVPEFIVTLPFQELALLLIVNVPPSALPPARVPVLLEMVNPPEPIITPESVMFRAVAAGAPLFSAMLRKELPLTFTVPL